VHLDLVRRTVDALGCRRLLDAGCGPASMLRHLAAPGRELYGFDLTPEMVAEARRIAGGIGLAPQRFWEGSVLNAADYTPPGETAAGFDAVVCSGVLPHIPEPADRDCIANLHAALVPGGHAIVEARNELFSLFTFNRYSHRFFLERLLPIDELRQAAGDEAAGVEQALQQLGGMFRCDLPPLRTGQAGEPGYDEVLSRSHNPLVLRDQFRQGGFDDVQLRFYHFHCLPPLLQAGAPRASRQVSLAMEANPGDWRGLFMASAFFVVARRT
jgi:SAM-dependent methyltransferase